MHLEYIWRNKIFFVKCACILLHMYFKRYIDIRTCLCRMVSRRFIRWTERMGERDEYLDELKNSINLPVHSRSRDIRRALSWRYASCGRRDMLILCGAFITRARDRACFTFMKYFARLILSTEKKLGKFFLTADWIARDPITREFHWNESTIVTDA